MTTNIYNFYHFISSWKTADEPMSLSDCDKCRYFYDRNIEINMPYISFFYNNQAKMTMIKLNLKFSVCLAFNGSLVEPIHHGIFRL